MAESTTKDDRFCKRINFAGGNLAAAWKTFKMQFNIYKVAKKYADLSEEEQISNMLVQMGNESVPIYSQFVFNTTSNKKTLDNTIRMFDDYFEPVKNVIYERAKFNTMKQGEKSIHQFIVELQNQADQCEYGTMKDDLIRDRIVVGVKDSKLREYLMDVDDLDLKKCIQKSKQWISNHMQNTKFEERGDENLDTIGSAKPEKKEKPKSYYDKDKISREKPCELCNRPFHRGRNCPAKFSVCKACGEKGHWAKSPRCKKSSKSVGEVEQSDVEETDSLFLADDL